MGGGWGAEEVSACGHVLLTPVEELLLRSSQHSEHHVKRGSELGLWIPADTPQHQTLKEYEAGKVVAILTQFIFMFGIIIILLNLWCVCSCVYIFEQIGFK